MYHFENYAFSISLDIRAREWHANLGLVIRWSPAITEGNVGAGDSTRAAAQVEGEGGDTLEQEIEPENESNDEETPDDNDEDEGGAPGDVSGVERGVSRMEL